MARNPQDKQDDLYFLVETDHLSDYGDMNGLREDELIEMLDDRDHLDRMTIIKGVKVEPVIERFREIS